MIGSKAAATPVKPSNFPINSTAPGASIAATPCCSPCLCRCKNTPTADPASSLQRRKEKIRCHASITSPAAPLWRPLLKRYGGDRISLQLIRHFLVATTAIRVKCTTERPPNSLRFLRKAGILLSDRRYFGIPGPPILSNSYTLCASLHTSTNSLECSTWNTCGNPTHPPRF